MFDTMTLTKIVGSLCGALLVFMMGNWAAETLYNTSPAHHGDDDHHAAGYVIETASADDGAAEVDEGPSLAELWANADIEKGAKVFAKCKACHKLEDGANATGPYLYGVVGRKIDTADGYSSYSGALLQLGDTWTPETLNTFLENPRASAPGTGMGFAGLKKATDRVNLIAYLDQLDGDTYEMAAPEPKEEAAADHGTETEAAAADEAAAEEATTEAPAAEEAAAADDASGFAAMVASADPAKGEKVFKKCKACHALEDGKNRVGPHLFNLIDRDIGSVDGFQYSDDLASAEGNWTLAQLDAFLAKPKEFAPGTKMSFAGLRKEDDRAAVIAYIQGAAQ